MIIGRPYIYLIPLNEQLLFSYNLNLGNGWLAWFTGTINRSNKDSFLELKAKQYRVKLCYPGRFFLWNSIKYYVTQVHNADRNSRAYIVTAIKKTTLKVNCTESGH